ncbi:gasdermin-C isoform X3 [Pteropus medius]|uniref:gasdermin-C isoform X3 n=1 Tax=Pteropus vampyrus TaxID=132908 RepID=UPI00196A70C5|nr:gasdermin-C isoform X3 [Pteropus giganteus]
MSSMFIKYSTALVKTIGDEELRPVTCFTHAIKIRQFSILEKSRFLFSESEVPHDISLMDILEPSSSVPDAAVREPFQLSDTATKEEEAGASVMSGADVTTSGEVMEFQGSSFQYQVVPTPNETWTELKKRKLLDPEPVFLRQCGERSINLYVVTETVKLLNSPVLHDISSMKDEGVGEGCKVREMKLTLPQGMVMAYKMKQLVFKEKGWDILRIADEKQKSFPESEWEMQPLLGRAQGFCRLVLSDFQQDLLVWSMKKKILLQQRDLVRSILEPNFKYLMDIPFTIKPEFLAPLQGEDLDITYRLLKECGLRMEPNSPRSIWVLNAKKPLSALYAALTVLQQLAEA